jgi:long-chain acyl-CoA synthetase
MNVFQNVIACSQLFPEKDAVLFEGDSISYGRLERLSAQAARVLQEYGVQRGDRVGMVIPNVPAFVVWYYATLRLGAVAVSISTRLAPQEVAFILSDCDAHLLVTTDEHVPVLQAHLPECIGQTVTTSDDAARYGDQQLSDSPALPPYHCVDTDPNDPAVILYTSGTTGFPKGATLSHQNIRATVHAFNHLCQMSAEDRILLGVPLFHCYGQNALLNSGLSVGVTLVLQRRADLNESKRLIRQHQVTKLFGVPTTFQLMLQSCTREDLSSVGYCFSAAATLPLQLAEQWLEQFGMPIFEGYGLTETAPFASYNHRLQYVPGSIGTPVDLVDMRIVDPESGQPCAAGERGEIVIRGPNVMLGYWNRPEETAAAIRNGWFHSGDIGFMDQRGFFYIVDRLKDMISIGGMKVFPAEVERVLLDHPSIEEVAVVGLPDDVMGEKVAAFIVAREVTEFSHESIRQHCHEKLGSFKTPKRIELVPELPRNPAGKVLKTRLRETWSQSEPVGKAEPNVSTASDTAQADAVVEGRGRPASEPPAVLLGERLARVHAVGRHRWLTEWLQQEVRQVAEMEEAPAADAMLIEAGLDSLMIVELRDRLQTQVGPQLQLQATLVFDHPRIHDLATFLLDSLADMAERPAGAHATTDSASVATQTNGPPVTPPPTATVEALEQIEEMSEQEALQELLRELDE